MGGFFRNSSVHNERASVPIASAASVNLRAATGNLVHITGNVQIEEILLYEGAERTLIFDGAPTLVHGANLQLPGNANINVTAGSRAVVRGDANGVVNFIDYTKDDGSALAGGSVPVDARIADQTLTSTDSGACLTASGTFSQTFDPAASLGDGWWCYYENADTGYVTLNPDGAETITVNGVAQSQWVLWPYEAGIVVCDGAGLRYYCIRKGRITQTIAAPVASVSWATGVAYRRKVAMFCEGVAVSGGPRLELKLNGNVSSDKAGYFNVTGVTVVGSANVITTRIANPATLLANAVGVARLYASINIDIGNIGTAAVIDAQFQDSGADNVHEEVYGFFNAVNAINITEIGLYITGAGNITAGTFTLQEI